MKKLLCVLAGAALLGACEQKSETVNPPADKSTTVVNPASTAVVKEKTKETTNTNTNTTTATTPATSSSTSTTTTTSSPSP
jgi:ABC-type uncharacterized transport system auxiliary subunit